MTIMKIKQPDGQIVNIPFGMSTNTGASVNTHNTDTTAHADIREQISQLSSEKVDSSQLTEAVESALAEAKESGSFDGAKGDNGKSAYEYAKDGGYTGTEAEFAQELSKINPVTSVNDKTGAVDINIADIDNLQKALDERADKSQGIFYIEGDSNSTTDTTNKVATWIGSHDEITEYFSGLTILYKVVTAGSTTTTLNINGLGAVAVVRNATTGISTACPVDGVLLLTYTVDSSGTAYWKTADYDANTKNTAGTSNKTGTKLFLVGGASQSSSGVTTYTNSNIYVTTDNVLYSAKGFSGNLTGNADTATKATQDASGNVITSTYETKADASEKFNNVNTQINQLSSEKVDRTGITLGMHTDGLLYLFIDGTPVGAGVEMYNGADVYGYVDSANNIVVQGKLADGTYSVKYELEDGTTLSIGSLVLDSNVYYAVTKNLTNCTISNSATEAIGGQSYSATITAKSGYNLKSVSATMGGTAVSVTNGVINIASVTGDIVITAVAEVSGPAYINQIPISTDSSGNPFVGTNGEKGFKTDTRLSGSSGEEKEQSGYEVTGFIPVKYGDVVRIKNIDVTNENNTTIAFFNSSKSRLVTASNTCQKLYTAFVEKGTLSDGVYAVSITNSVLASITNDLAFIRFSSNSITNESVVTVNEEIS